MIFRTYSIKEIADILDADILGSRNDLNLKINRLATDSRFRGLGANSCFFAIQGYRNDGHQYISDAYEKGVRCFVVSKDWSDVNLSDAVFLKVDNTLKALQKLASNYRSEIQYPIVAVTGSNGKTIVKEWLFQFFSVDRKVSRSPKSYNSQLGVPLSMLMLSMDSDIGIIEAGISQKGEMNFLKEMIRPNIGIITNIHSAHLENFKNKEELAMEKLSLYKDCEALIYRKDYRELRKILDNDSEFRKVNKISWSVDKSLNPEVLVEWHKEDDKTKLSLQYKNESLELDLNFTDLASIENAVHCIICARFIGLNDRLIADVSKFLPSVAMRLEQLDGINNCTIINDSYNSDLVSLEVALNFLNMQKQHSRKTLILSDIFQSGLPARELYQKACEMCLENGIDRLVGIGSEILSQQDVFTLPFEGFETTDLFLDHLSEMDFFDEAILLKGSRKFQFERISNLLELKKHETLLEVNLSAVIDNLNFFKGLLNPDVGVMVMVKAFSYGTGSFEIANVLEHHGVDYLAVAYLDEGLELRRNGINCSIMVMNPAFGEIEKLAKNNLEPEVYNLSDLRLIDKYSKDSKLPVKIHIKVESGMNRLGFEMDQIDELIQILNLNNLIQVKTVFSHLVGSDDAELDDFTKEQERRFDLFCLRLKEAEIGAFKQHILNSDGILRFPNMQKDMVRLGIGLYGISSVLEYRNSLRSVVRLKSRISQIKHIKKGDSVGYARAFVADKDMKIATVPIGYADGLVRNLSNGNWYFRIGGNKAPIVGNICMDMTMIDVSNIEGIRGKDEVVIMDGSPDIYKMAEKRGTIAYEILTSLSERVKRSFYYGE